MERTVSGSLYSPAARDGSKGHERQFQAVRRHPPPPVTGLKLRNQDRPSRFHCRRRTCADDGKLQRHNARNGGRQIRGPRTVGKQWPAKQEDGADAHVQHLSRPRRGHHTFLGAELHHLPTIVLHAASAATKHDSHASSRRRGATYKLRGKAKAGCDGRGDEICDLHRGAVIRSRPLSCCSVAAEGSVDRGYSALAR